MRIVAISDTHNKHQRLIVPEGDVIVHAGDATMNGAIAQVKAFAGWYGALPHKTKIFVAGNHDLGFESTNQEQCRQVLKDNGIVYLQDSSICVGGATFYGSPWQPEFYDWAFNLPRGKALADKWAKIPDGTDVLVTHGPPFAMLDITEEGAVVGCEELALRVRALRPKVHIFGHIHEGYGKHFSEEYDVMYVNASSCNRQYQAVNPPLTVDV